MRGKLSGVTEGRAGLVLGGIALIVALSGTALALPGTNSVNSGDIKNGQVSVQDLKIAYVFFDGDGDIVQRHGITAIDRVNNQVLCFNLKFKPKTASATRGADNGGDFTAPNVALPPVAGELCDPPFDDAEIQVPGQPDSFSTYVNFFG